MTSGWIYIFSSRVRFPPWDIVPFQKVSSVTADLTLKWLVSFYHWTLKICQGAGGSWHGRKASWQTVLLTNPITKPEVIWSKSQVESILKGSPKTPRQTKRKSQVSSHSVFKTVTQFKSDSSPSHKNTQAQYKQLMFLQTSNINVCVSHTLCIIMTSVQNVPNHDHIKSLYLDFHIGSRRRRRWGHSGGDVSYFKPSFNLRKRDTAGYF